MYLSLTAGNGATFPVRLLPVGNRADSMSYAWGLWRLPTATQQASRTPPILGRMSVGYYAWCCYRHDILGIAPIILVATRLRFQVFHPLNPFLLDGRILEPYRMTSIHETCATTVKDHHYTVRRMWVTRAVVEQWAYRISGLTVQVHPVCGRIGQTLVEDAALLCQGTRPKDMRCGSCTQWHCCSMKVST